MLASRLTARAACLSAAYVDRFTRELAKEQLESMQSVAERAWCAHVLRPQLPSLRRAALDVLAAQLVRAAVARPALSLHTSCQPVTFYCLFFAGQALRGADDGDGDEEPTDSDLADADAAVDSASLVAGAELEALRSLCECTLALGGAALYVEELETPLVKAAR